MDCSFCCFLSPALFLSMLLRLVFLDIHLTSKTFFLFRSIFFSLSHFSSNCHMLMVFCS